MDKRNNHDSNPTPRHKRLSKEQLRDKGQRVLQSEIDRRKRLGIPIHVEQD